MRKESETLLKIIGTDEEVGTHGAVPRYIALVKAIEQGKDVYGCFNGLNVNKGMYRQAVIELAPFLNQMSEGAFARLMFFSQELGFVDNELGKAIKGEYALPAWCEEQVGKRARFLQTFSKVKPRLFSYHELEKETEVREKYPWQWIDTMGEVNRETAQKEIIKQLCQTKDFRPFYARIPFYVRKMPRGQEYLEGIMRGVKGKIPKTEFESMKEHIARSKNFKTLRH